MSKKLKAIGIVSAATVVSRVLGLVRDQLGAAFLGAGLLNSAFLTAFNTPNLFRRLLAEGALTAAFVPTLQHELKDHGEGGAFALLNKVASRLLLVTSGICLLAMFVAGNLRWWGGHDEKWYLAGDLTALLFPYLLCICMAAAFNATLQVLHRFTEPALSPIWLNLSMILSLGVVGSTWAANDGELVLWQCAGVLVGGLLQMVVPAAVLVKLGWKPKFDLAPSPRVHEIARLMAPALFGTAIYQINVYVSRLLAFSIDDAAASVLFYSNRLMELPIGVFAVAVSTVVYPLIAKHAAENKLTEMAEDYLKGIRLILLLNVPAAVGLAVLSEPIVRVLFERRQFTPADTALMSPLVALFAVGMPFFAVVSLTTRAFFAVKDTKTPVKVAAVSFVVNLGLSFALKDVLGAAGLVIASTVAVIVQMVILQRVLERKLPHMSFATLFRPVGKMLVATAFLGLVVAGGAWAVRHADWPQVVADWVQLLVLIPLGVAVYAGALWWLRIEERTWIIEAVRRKTRAKTA